MKIFPAIDLFEGKAVRLYKGDYNEMTVYSDKPWEIALDFKNSGAEYIHIVDLEGAKDGTTPNIETIRKIIDVSGLKAEVGGGVRNMETVEKYIQAGVMRVILGTAAVKDREFLVSAVKKYGEKVAVGADILNGNVAIKGWTETSDITMDDFFKDLVNIGVKTVICTDITKDGTMQGTNRQMYKELSEKYKIDIVASGGVNSIEDIKALKEMNLYGAIIGKAYYLGVINIKEAIEVTGC
ncbi:MAG: 1-(5-phosphoribosyl)-5-[(5-phosphoribosylamino)methylideneamino]imidazole-4-carboxamide isomerase [Clostridiales bacterium]|nr:1-(5-phosphoribosyl)-5-[(5-phosphoribosylamino)methylideneamino]imidazole-4-carboxamide isomerase [Clostridiales bacterium]